MIGLSVQTLGLRASIAALQGQAKQVRFATAVALTRTAKKIQERMPDVMERELDKPTQFTKRGMFVKPARKDNLTAVVGFRDIQAKYLRFQIEGGSRQPRSAGIKLPGNVELNSFGNIPRGLIKRLKAAAQNGTLGAAIAKRTGGAAKGAKLFLGKPKGKGNLPMGIWRREAGKLTPVILFVDQPVRYRKRFNFTAAAQKIARDEWQSIFDAALREALQ